MIDVKGLGRSEIAPLLPSKTADGGKTCGFGGGREGRWLSCSGRGFGTVTFITVVGVELDEFEKDIAAPRLLKLFISPTTAGMLVGGFAVEENIPTGGVAPSNEEMSDFVGDGPTTSEDEMREIWWKTPV